MTRTLFLQEFKRSLFQTATLLFPFLLGFIAIERLLLSRPWFRLPAGTPDAFIDILISALIVVSAFARGIGTFYRLTDQHIAFIHSLPVHRVQMWTVVVSANIAALVLLTPLVFVLRPALWTRTDVWAIGNLWPFALGTYLVLFAAGCCFVMLFRTVALTVIAAALFVAASQAVTFVFASQSYTGAGRERWYGIFFSGRQDPAFWLFSSIVLAIMFLGLSLRFFMAGELRLLTARIRNWVFLCGVLATYPLVNAAAFDSRILERPSDVQRDFNASVSHDGKYLAVAEILSESRIVASKITIVDVAGGTRRGVYDSGNLIAPLWSKSAPVINAIAVQSSLRRLGYLLPPSDFIIRLSPEAEVLDRLRFGFSEITSIHATNDGEFLVLTESGSETRLFSVDDEMSRELFRTATKEEADLYPTSRRSVMVVNSPPPSESDRYAQIDRAWFVDEKIQELQWASAEKNRTNEGFVLDGQLYSQESLLQEFKKRFPPKQDRFSYLLPRFDFYGAVHVSAKGSITRAVQVVPSEYIFALAGGEKSSDQLLLYYRKQSSEWKVLGNVLDPLPARLLPASWPPGNGIVHAGFRYPATSDGVTLFSAPKSLDREIYLYDAKLDRSFLLLTLSANEGSGCLMRPAARVDDHLVECGRFRLLYSSANGLKKLPPARGTTLFVNADGASIYRTSDRVVYQSADGKERPLWPLP